MIPPEFPTTRSHLFVLRLWHEDIGDGMTDWRGRIHHIKSGEVEYFRDWQTLEKFLLDQINKQESV